MTMERVEIKSKQQLLIKHVNCLSVLILHLKARPLSNRKLQSSHLQLINGELCYIHRYPLLPVEQQLGPWRKLFLQSSKKYFFQIASLSVVVVIQSSFVSQYNCSRVSKTVHVIEFKYFTSRLFLEFHTQIKKKCGFPYDLNITLSEYYHVVMTNKCNSVLGGRMHSTSFVSST